MHATYRPRPPLRPTAPPPSGPPARSAFVAAFLSFILPGLGQAYLGRWLRALAWVALPVIVTALVIGIALSSDRNELAGQLLIPAVQLAVLGAIVVDLLYRLAAMLDAWRLGQVPRGATTGVSRLASTIGLLAIVLVLVVSHVAIARPVYSAYDTLSTITDGGDDTPIPSGSLAPEIAELLATALPSDPGLAGGEVTPAPDPRFTPPPTATPPPEYAWDGKKRLDILLIGADGGRIGAESYLTDTMIVVSVDPPTGRVAFISLPRDTSGVPLPSSWAAHRHFGGSFPGKINTLYTTARYAPGLFPGNDRERGFRALKGALSELYGLNIQYHVAVDLRGFRDVINALGGVVIDVQVPVQDDGYPADDGRGKLKLYIPPGMQYMSGPKALAYARSRHLSSDFDRSGRQQRIITSVRDQTDLSELFEPGVLDQLLKSVKENIKTDIPPDMLPKLVALAQKVDINRRVSLVLSPPTFGSECYPCPPNGLYVLKANVPAMRRAAQNVFDSDPKVEARRQAIESEGALVHVLNGTPGTNLKTTRTAEALAALGVNATVPPVNAGRAETDDYTDTVITVLNGREADFPETIKLLQRTFGVQAVTAEDPTERAGILVVVGRKSPNLSS
jgi:LCP family protein required for cell wall assembly